uniref:Ig-like domain-containing protein n=1 Tax=Steinernema glaseri TaxID=37863 RepID=A0A1I7ZBI1_9BILA
MISVMQISILLRLVVSFVFLGHSSASLFKPSRRSDPCDLSWLGKWHVHDRAHPVHINGSFVETLGSCVASNAERNEYIFSLKTSSGECTRCAIFFPMHDNILRYKSTSCLAERDSSSLDVAYLCRNFFRGDTSMVTLFRADAKTEDCGLVTPANLTYQTAAGQCTSRVSSLTECSSKNRFRITYQGCPEVPHSETHGVEFRCIGSWSSFGQKFTAIKIVNQLGVPTSATYRCLIHERHGPNGRIGISADSSCQELTQLFSASTIITYKADVEVIPFCKFPHFLKRSWSSIVTEHNHTFEDDVWHETWGDKVYARSLCIQHEDYGHMQKFVLFVTRNCDRGYQCVKIIKRKHHIIDVIRGPLMNHESGSCDNIDHHLETLVIPERKEKCPWRGQMIINQCSEYSIRMGCLDEEHVEFNPHCQQKDPNAMSCVGHWSESGSTYLITKDLKNNKLGCSVYARTRDGSFRIQSFSHVGCQPIALSRTRPEYEFNATHHDHCGPNSAILAPHFSFSFVMLGFVCLFW